MTLALWPPADATDSAWLALRRALWPDGTADEHLLDMRNALARGHFVRIAFDAGAAVGFVETSLRSDYVNGTESSPVGFLEGLYVVPAHRRRGVARALVDASTAWAIAQGCSEFASDALVANVAAHAMHRALGFAEADRVVYFHKHLR